MPSEKRYATRHRSQRCERVFAIMLIYLHTIRPGPSRFTGSQDLRKVARESVVQGNPVFPSLFLRRVPDERLRARSGAFDVRSDKTNRRVWHDERASHGRLDARVMWHHRIIARRTNSPPPRHINAYRKDTAVKIARGGLRTLATVRVLNMR